MEMGEGNEGGVNGESTYYCFRYSNLNEQQLGTESSCTIFLHLILHMSKNNTAKLCYPGGKYCK